VTGMPKLSETLTHADHPEVCRACGALAEPGGPGADGWTPLTRWRECDDFDRPTRTVVVLCKACAGKIVEPHPRLYIEIPWLAPYPGTVPLCVPCPHRNGTHCPMAAFNGGPGVELIGPAPSHVHLYRRGKGAVSGWVDLYPGWPTRCEVQGPKTERSDPTDDVQTP
jgi:hypothetical protein